MTGEQGLFGARIGLVLDGVLGLLLGAVLVLTAPIMLLEGEELGAIVLGVVWGGVAGGLGLAALALAAVLDRSWARWAARALVMLQLVVLFCFCGVLPLFAMVAVWLGLLVADREEG